MSYQITAIIQQEEDWYVAKCAENNVASQGKTLNDALANLREELELYYEDSDEKPFIKQTFVTTMEIAI